VRRHELDWVSLIAGIVFTGIAALYLVVAGTDLSIDHRLVWPVVFVALGLAGVATAVRGARRTPSPPSRSTPPNRRSDLLARHDDE